MKNLGTQYLNKLSKIPVEENNMLHKPNTESLEVREVLRQFQNGYTKRDIKNIDYFVEELFIISDDTYILGTGTGELFLGIEQVKTLLKNDWEYWGDVNIDLENIHIDIENEVAWFAAAGTVKYTFQDTVERYDNYLNFIKNKTKESELTARQKVALINWVLALTYHQRLDKQREYLWALRLSGVLLKDNGKWKFAQLHFSIPKSNFPDERFENSNEFIISYENQNAIADKYLNSKSQIDIEIKSLFESLETELFGQHDISKELISKYFTIDSAPYIIGADNKWYIGADQIKEFFDINSGTTLELDIEHAIVSKQSRITWVTVCGLLKGSLTEEELYERVLDDIDNLSQANVSSKDKLFAIHRSVSYALKESASGENFTCPIRLTAVVKNHMGRPVFQNIHFSFPCYWIFEGKLDSF